MGGTTGTNGSYLVNGIEVSRDGVPVIPLTEAQLAQIDNNVAQVANLDLPKLYDASNPNSRVFVLSLDGTSNNANVDPPENWTNPALIAKSVNALNQQNPNIAGWYQQGVGTADIPIPIVSGAVNTLDQATGASIQQQAEQGYAAFVVQANVWLHENPDAEISLVNVGFSRGSAATLLVANMVHERGIPDLNTEKRETSFDSDTMQSRTVITYGSNLVEPGRTPQAIIPYDQVATGTAEDLNRTVPPSVVSVVEFRAENEYRSQFKFYSTRDPNNPDDSRFTTLTNPGSHADQGGGDA